jgi:hypothetical protein
MAQSVIGSLRVNLELDSAQFERDVWDAANPNMPQQAGTSNPLRNKGFPIYPARNNISWFSLMWEFRLSL